MLGKFGGLIGDVTSPSGAATFLELLTKFALAAFTVSYGLGYLILGFHLARYGAPAGGILRADYVLAGATFLIFAALASTWMFSVVRTLRGLLLRKEKFDSRHLPRAILFPWMIYALINILSLPADLMSHDRIFATAMVLFSVFIVGLGFRSARRGWRRAFDADDSPKPWLAVHSSINLVIASLAALLLYACFVFPQILPVYGGGRPLRVRLRLTDDGKKALSLNRPAASDGSLSCYLITETDDWVVIATDLRDPNEGPGLTDPSAIRIKRDFVDVVENAKTADR